MGKEGLYLEDHDDQMSLHQHDHHHRHEEMTYNQVCEKATKNWIELLQSQAQIEVQLMECKRWDIGRKNGTRIHLAI